MVHSLSLSLTKPNYYQIYFAIPNLNRYSRYLTGEFLLRQLPRKSKYGGLAQIGASLAYPYPIRPPIDLTRWPWQLPISPPKIGNFGSRENDPGPYLTIRKTICHIKLIRERNILFNYTKRSPHIPVVFAPSSTIYIIILNLKPNFAIPNLKTFLIIMRGGLNDGNGTQKIKMLNFKRNQYSQKFYRIIRSDT